MTRSMTAFARQEQVLDTGTLSWELRSVNQRYLEPHLRLPDQFRALEPKLRDLLRKGLTRGKVECHLRWHPASQDIYGRSPNVKPNETIAFPFRSAYSLTLLT